MSEYDRDETISSPFTASQSHTVLLEDAEVILFPSGENTTNNTDLRCPLRGAPMESPFSVSQSCTVLLEDAEAILFPSGENTTDLTLSRCPSKTWRDLVHKYALDVTLGRDWICWLYNMYIGDVSGLIARAE